LLLDVVTPKSIRYITPVVDDPYGSKSDSQVYPRLFGKGRFGEVTDPDLPPRLFGKGRFGL